MKKAIAMKCTQEQWDSIKNRIPKGMINDDKFDLIEYPYLTNNYNAGFIKGIGTHDKDFIKSNVKIHETFNAKIFLDACGIDCEPKYSITKLQLTQLLKNNEEGNEQLVSADLRAWFPDAFKKELEVGKWMKTPIGGLYCPKEKQGDGFICYGFTPTSRTYKDIFVLLDITKDDVEATLQEVEAALISEAKKRGYRKGVTIGTQTIDDDKYRYYSDNTLYIWDTKKIGINIFQNGIWATIIQPEKMTLEQIEKELGRKIELI